MAVTRTLLDAYQHFVRTTEAGTVKAMNHKERLSYFALGLAGETGEAIDKIKKLIRDHDGQVPDQQFLEDMVKELGDPLWYLTQLCDEISNGCFSSTGFTIETLFRENMNKLNDRLARGVIQGSGDNR